MSLQDFKDPLGREPGEPLDPLRHNYEDLLIRQRGNPRLWAAVWQQSPRSVGGHIIKPEWFGYVAHNELPRGIRWVRAWDLAFSSKQVSKSRPDFTAGCLMGVLRVDKSVTNFYIKDIVRWQADWPDSRKQMLEIAKSDGREVKIIVEGGGPQKALADSLKVDPEFSQYIIRDITPVQDKVARAQHWADKAELGRLKIIKGAWTSVFFDECEAFDNGLNDDQIDSVSLAYWYISQFMIGVGPKFMKVRGLYVGRG